MKFIKGEKVKFLNNVGGGVVVKILKDNMVEVRTDDGFEYPVLVDELISIDEEITNRQYGFTTESEKRKIERIIQNKSTEKDDIIDNQDIEEEFNWEKNVENEPQTNDDINIYFAFVPTVENIEKADFMAYLVNDCNYSIFYNIYSSIEIFRNKHGILSANSKELLHTFKNDKVNEIQSFTFQLIFYKNEKHDKKTVIEKELKIDAKSFFSPKKFTENDFFYEDSLVLSVINEDGMRAAMENLVKKEIEKALSEKLKAQNAEKKSNYIKHIQPKDNEKIVDLHIHELIENEEGLSRKDILDIQMKRFKDELEVAIKNKLGRIIFIHGVGNGRLKLEIWNELKKPKFKKLSYQDASFKEYGYGATLVII